MTSSSVPALNSECAKRLRQLRKRMGLSRPKFAEMLGIPPATLKNYELNYRGISGGTLLLIANHPVLSPHVVWLATGQGDGRTSRRFRHE